MIAMNLPTLTNGGMLLPILMAAALFFIWGVNKDDQQ